MSGKTWDPVTAEIRSMLRRRLAAQGRQALAAGDLDAAKRLFMQTAEFLRQEADESSDLQVRERRFAASAFYEEQARVIETEAAVPAEPAPSQRNSLDASREWRQTSCPETTLDDVVGLADVKTAVRRSVLIPYLHRDEAMRYGLDAGGGLLLFGPPGTGKTLLARAIAGELRAPLFVAKGSDILSKWHGESNKNLASLFAAARAHEMSVIVIDEFQGLVPRGGGAPSSEASQSLLAQLLQELQGFEQHADSAVLFIAATNYPWDVDPAAIRLGRFSKHIFVPLPDRPARETLFRRALAGRPAAPDIAYGRLADHSNGYNASDIIAICTSALCRACEESIARAKSVVVTHAMIEDELAATRPSVSPDLLDKYAEWQEGADAL